MSPGRRSARRNAIRVYRGLGGYVVVEPAKLIEGQDKRRVLPTGPGHNCIDKRGHKLSSGFYAATGRLTGQRVAIRRMLVQANR